MTDGERTEAARLIAQARRITVKVGSSLLVGADGYQLREDWLRALATDVTALRADGRQLLLVSSGAVVLGRRTLGLDGRRSTRLDEKQAAAAVGQPLLMSAWARAFEPCGAPVAQLLLTLGDVETRHRWLNARATLETLLSSGVVPVINENDSVATEELRVGDNDRLSARAAQLARSDVLVLLSDIDGLYTADPRRDPSARHIPLLDAITPEVEACAGGPITGGMGTGGMRTKLEAARIARLFGCATIITAGEELHPLRRLLAGGRATVVGAAGTPTSAYKQWIAGSLRPAGEVAVDDGAASALARGSSLLPAGVAVVRGEWDRGACLRVLDLAGVEIARGLTEYGSTEARAIIGRPSHAIAEVLGWRGPDELIHRDDMVLM